MIVKNRTFDQEIMHFSFPILNNAIDEKGKEGAFCVSNCDSVKAIIMR